MDGPEPHEDAAIWRFDAFEIDLHNRELRRDSRTLALGSRYFDALVLLAGHPNELITKDRFMADVWRGIPVTDEALTQCIRTLRRALGDDAAAPRFVATVPKHGYRFLAEVTRSDRTLPAPAAAVPPPPRLSAGGRIAGATTLGGGLAGALGGLVYAVLATTGGGTAVLVMVALVAALGVLGGSGVGIGMGLAVSLRGQGGWPLVAGGAAGGMLIGAFGQTLGRDGIAALTGATIPQITGLSEGLMLGAATGLSAILALRSRASGRAIIGGAAVIGAFAGAVIALSGGSLLGRSLMFLEAQFPASDLALGKLGRLFGADGFTAGAQLATGMLEAATFTGCIAAALQRIRDR